MKGVLTINIKEDSYVQQIIDRLIIQLQLTKVVPLPKNTIMQDDKKYYLQFNTDLTQQQLLSKIKNSSQMKGLNVICQRFDSQAKTSQASKLQEHHECKEEQYSKNTQTNQKASILRQLQFIQNSQDSQQEQPNLQKRNKKQDDQNKMVSEIKSEDQFEILQEVISIKSFESEIKIEQNEKKQVKNSEAPNTSKLQEHLNKSKQNNTQVQPKQNNQKLQISEKQSIDQQRQPPSDNEQDSTDRIFKYSRGKDDYSTVFKIQPQDNTQQHIAEIIKQHQPKNVQEKQLGHEVNSQKYNSQCLLHKSTASGLESNSVDIFFDATKQRTIQIQNQSKQEVNQQALSKQNQILVQIQKQVETIKIQNPHRYIEQARNNLLLMNSLITEKKAQEKVSSNVKKLSKLKHSEPINSKFDRKYLILGAVLVAILGLYLIF